MNSILAANIDMIQSKTLSDSLNYSRPFWFELNLLLHSLSNHFSFIYLFMCRERERARARVCARFFPKRASFNWLKLYKVHRIMCSAALQTVYAVDSLRVNSIITTHWLRNAKLGSGSLVNGLHIVCANKFKYLVKVIPKNWSCVCVKSGSMIVHTSLRIPCNIFFISLRWIALFIAFTFNKM